MKDYAFLLLFGVVFSIFRFGNLQMCANIKSFGKQILTGQKSAQTPLWTTSGKGLLQCVNTCQLNSMCLSINFYNKNGTCELMTTRINGLTLEYADGYIATNINEWPKDGIGNCVDHMCSIETLCESLCSGYRCKTIGCFNIETPFADRIQFTLKIYDFGEELPKPCENGYYTNDTVKCLENGTWSKFTCSPYEKITSCQALHETCNPSYNDGEYWLYPQFTKGVKAKVYCANMTGKPKEYVSLLENNFASRSIYIYDSTCSPVMASQSFINNNGLGYTNFQKVALDKNSGNIYSDDFTFTWTNYTKINYGISADCLPLDTTCSVLGRFKINLKGTGFVLHSDVIWILDKPSSTMDIYLTDENRRITGICGKGCNGCKPKREVKVASDPSYTPSDESAIRPICWQNI